MDPRELLKYLMDKAGENPNSLASALKQRTKQPQIYKFLEGMAKEPRRSTLQPIADHYQIPVEALYDPVIADAVMDAIKGGRSYTLAKASSIPPVTKFGTPTATQTDPPLVIPQYAVGGGMGRGFNLTDNPPGHIKSWHVDHEWLRLNVPAHTGLRNLAIVTGFGPSMRPMFNPGDPLLVDTGVRHIDHEGVYFFRVGEEGFIKLIQRVPEFDGPGVILRVISKNPDFPPYDISPKNPHFEILGKVLTIWRSEHF